MDKDIIINKVIATILMIILCIAFFAEYINCKCGSQVNHSILQILIILLWKHIISFFDKQKLDIYKWITSDNHF